MRHKHLSSRLILDTVNILEIIKSGKYSKIASI